MSKKINLLIMMCFTLTTLTYAQEEESEAEALAKKLSNPIASLISVPFQNNTDYGIGDAGGTRNTLNIQPVIPISISSKLNLITRIVMPVVTQYNITGVGEKESGLSDFVVSGFVSPKEAKNGITWGVGPVLLLPLGTNDYLTTKKFGVGPTAVILKQTHGWTFGGLVNQIWSVAGNEDRPDVSQMFLQPFLTYNWKSGAGLGATMEYTQNWEADVATVFITPTISGVTSLGKQKVQLVIGPRFNIAAASGAKADIGLRAMIVFLFPKK